MMTFMVEWFNRCSRSSGVLFCIIGVLFIVNLTGCTGAENRDGVFADLASDERSAEDGEEQFYIIREILLEIPAYSLQDNGTGPGVEVIFPYAGGWEVALQRDLSSLVSDGQMSEAEGEVWYVTGERQILAKTRISDVLELRFYENSVLVESVRYVVSEKDIDEERLHITLPHL
ncbi:MAG: hypothetical protein ACOCWO_04760 [Candidatus Muiribacteriaceae bacterium]